MAISHAQFVGPTPDEAQRQATNQWLQVGGAFLQARQFEEAKKQADIQNAANQMQEYVKAQAGGDYKYAAETNPIAMKSWLTTLFPKMDPDEILKSVSKGPQTYGQKIAAMTAEITDERVGADYYATSTSMDDFLKKLPSEQSTQEGTPPPKEDKGTTDQGGDGKGKTTVSMTSPAINKAAMNMDSLRKLLKAESSSPVTGIGREASGHLVMETGLGSLGLPVEEVNRIKNSEAYTRAKELIAQGYSPDQAVSSLVGSAIIPPQEGVNLAVQTAGTKAQENKGQGSKGVFKAGIEKATPEERQLAQGIGQKVLSEVQANPSVPISAIVDKTLEGLGLPPDAIIRQGMLGGEIPEASRNKANAWAKSKGIQGAEGLTNLRLSIIQNVTDAIQGKQGTDLGNVREGVEWTKEGMKGSPETAKAVETLGDATGTKMTSVLKTKTMDSLTDRERATLIRDVTKATQGAIREFQVTRRQDDSLERQMVSARYSSMANALKELGMDLPETHPVLRAMSNRPQLVEEAYKIALTDAARAGIMTREQAMMKYKLEEQKANNESLKLALENNKALNEAYAATGKLLNDAVDSWMKNSKEVNRQSTNPFADAYKYDRMTKTLFDKLMDIEEQATGKRRKPEDSVYDVKNSSWWTILPFTPKYGTESTSFGGATRPTEGVYKPSSRAASVGSNY